ncbi:DUF2244 domain-containing protein [Alteromonas sp. BMJM2]|uniref:DUF2244 domain-containing protein n=1 Tax=Alteromonas sp. BMJM2 TaxID=2954241 RepID=UPI0022B3AE29|nr:DUF2244 domain-containing protein [Alteromonas sp. BMJM2]
MIVVSTENNDTVIHITPNRSATWKQTKFLMLAFALFISSIATAWAVAGAWVILPFAGAEVFTLICVMYITSRATYRWEDITITPATIEITTSQDNRWMLNKTASYLYFIEDTRFGRLPRIILKDDLCECEVGSFLNESDKDQLSTHLTSAGLLRCSNKWW